MDYYDHPSMSRSKLVDLDRMTPYAWYCKHINKTINEPKSDALILGSAFHAYVLEYHKFKEQYVVAPNVRANTKVFKEFEELHKDKTILKHSQHELLNEMLFSLANHPAKKILNSCDLKEEEFYFTIEDIEFKSKLDAVNSRKNIIFDVKTCRESFLSGESFAKEMINHHNAEQVFIYSEAYRQRYGNNPKFYFICVEKKEPYEVQIFDASCLYEYGYKKTLELINKYKELKERYGDEPWIDSSIQVAELPYYAHKYLENGEYNE